MASLAAIMDELAATLDDVLGTTALNDEAWSISARLNLNPSEPAIDIYPADPFRTTEEAAFGETSGAYNFTVRARVAGDAEGRQDLLLSLMDDEHALCVATALQDDQTLNGLASSVEVDGPSGYTIYVEGTGSALIGCEWKVAVLNVTT